MSRELSEKARGKLPAIELSSDDDSVSWSTMCNIGARSCRQLDDSDTWSTTCTIGARSGRQLEISEEVYASEGVDTGEKSGRSEGSGLARENDSSDEYEADDEQETRGQLFLTHVMALMVVAQRRAAGANLPRTAFLISSSDDDSIDSGSGSPDVAAPASGRDEAPATAEADATVAESQNGTKRAAEDSDGESRVERKDKQARADHRGRGDAQKRQAREELAKVAAKVPRLAEKQGDKAAASGEKPQPAHPARAVRFAPLVETIGATEPVPIKVTPECQAAEPESAVFKFKTQVPSSLEGLCAAETSTGPAAAEDKSKAATDETEQAALAMLQLSLGGDAPAAGSVNLPTCSRLVNVASPPGTPHLRPTLVRGHRIRQLHGIASPPRPRNPCFDVSRNKDSSMYGPRLE